jgi:hypothetical protein
MLWDHEVTVGVGSPVAEELPRLATLGDPVESGIGHGAFVDDDDLVVEPELSHEGFLVIPPGLHRVPNVDHDLEPGSTQSHTSWIIALMVSTVGCISGSAFALILSSAEQRKSIRELSTWRAALWGALGGAALPLLTSMNDSVLLNTIPLGAMFAASTVAIARRAVLREAEPVEQLPPDSASPRLSA